MMLRPGTTIWEGASEISIEKKVPEISSLREQADSYQWRSHLDARYQLQQRFWDCLRQMQPRT